MCTPVLAGNMLFGLSERNSGQLFCLDAKNGQSLWTGPPRLESSASIINAGSVWLVLTTRGQLLVVKPSNKSYEQIAKYQVSESRTWAHPVFLGDRILVRDDQTLRSLRTGAARVSKPDK